MQLDERLPRLLADASFVYHDSAPVGAADELGGHLRRTAQRGTQLRPLSPLLRQLRCAPSLSCHRVASAVTAHAVFSHTVPNQESLSVENAAKTQLDTYLLVWSHADVLMHQSVARTGASNRQQRSPSCTAQPR